MSVRDLIVLGVGVLPPSKVKYRLLRLMGWQLEDGIVIGPGIYMRIGRVKMGAGARIGAFNTFRDLREVRLGDRATVGQWNWVTAARALTGLIPGGGTFELGDDAAVTARHYIDCSGGVGIGAFTTIAGVRSTFITHGIDWDTSAQSTSRIDIGEYCLIGSNAKIVPGTVIRDRVVTGMGATLAGEMERGSLFVGPRASLRRGVLPGGYFERRTGHVYPPQPSDAG